MDIYCSSGRCPICDSTMIRLIRYSFTCINNCYNYYRGVQNHYFSFFNYDEIVIQIPFEELSKEWTPPEDMLHPIFDKIAHWKQDERYLMKILVDSL